MKKLITLFLLISFFSCRHKEKNFPKTLEDFSLLEKEKMEKRLEKCNSKLARKLCKNSWYVLPNWWRYKYNFDPEKEILLRKVSKESEFSEFEFNCNSTFLRKKGIGDWFWIIGNKRKEDKWELKLDTLKVYCTDNKISYDYLVSRLDSIMILEFINENYQFPFGKSLPILDMTILDPGGDIPFQPSILPYLDSINSSK